MINMITFTSCQSCRKAKKWMDNHGVAYQEIEFNYDEWKQLELSREMLLKILSLTENGTEDITSLRSASYKELSQRGPLTMNQLIDFLLDNPKVLRRPLIYDEKRLQVGFNEDGIRQFIPKEKRRAELIALHL